MILYSPSLESHIEGKPTILRLEFIPLVGLITANLALDWDYMVSPDWQDFPPFLKTK